MVTIWKALDPSKPEMPFPGVSSVKFNPQEAAEVYKGIIKREHDCMVVSKEKSSLPAFAKPVNERAPWAGTVMSRAEIERLVRPQSAPHGSRGRRATGAGTPLPDRSSTANLQRSSSASGTQLGGHGTSGAEEQQSRRTAERKSLGTTELRTRGTEDRHKRSERKTGGGELRRSSSKSSTSSKVSEIDSQMCKLITMKCNPYSKPLVFL
eukprot:gnl/TRDRNA2_/TRDRNA2_198792_c0_seq1.p1 gnl/TRDRNA2_/TRDRNA2_198792_c0~~gnl/TRDRNA2_/TRDRNA2_198792_c0_seq1.p1  ORF type:complete len:209 (-),score=34.99 gnl/TRDRNA2_/TRDRNA2_198792_c0_seq1:46-672(-)